MLEQQLASVNWKPEQEDADKSSQLEMELQRRDSHIHMLQKQLDDMVCNASYN